MLGSIMTPWFKHWHEQEANALWRARMIESRIAIEWIRIAPQEMDRALARIAKCTQLKLVRVPKLEGEPSVIDLGEILTEDSDG
jgi:hypothetical protein